MGSISAFPDLCFHYRRSNQNSKVAALLKGDSILWIVERLVTHKPCDLNGGRQL